MDIIIAHVISRDMFVFPVPITIAVHITSHRIGGELPTTLEQTLK